MSDAELQRADASDETATTDDQPLDEVDWSALWAELGCPQDDYMSSIQLDAALEVSEQDITASLPPLDGPGQESVPDGLVAQWTRGADTANTLRGFYLHPEVRDDG